MTAKYLTLIPKSPLDSNSHLLRYSKWFTRLQLCYGPKKQSWLRKEGGKATMRGKLTDTLKSKSQFFWTLKELHFQPLELIKRKVLKKWHNKHLCKRLLQNISVKEIAASHKIQQCDKCSQMLILVANTVILVWSIISVLDDPPSTVQREVAICLQ